MNPGDSVWFHLQENERSAAYLKTCAQAEECWKSVVAHMPSNARETEAIHRQLQEDV